MKNFLGQDGFIWWIGIVEDIADPLRLGRCKVRCFGYHPPKKDTSVPTEDLPWAIAIHPVNTPNLYATPKVGDWVFGFFFDGIAAQEPGILGYFPSIPAASQEYYGATPSGVRSFVDVSEMTKNISNTIYWQTPVGHILEIDDTANTILIQHTNGSNLIFQSNSVAINHFTGTKIDVDVNGKVSIYTSNTVTLEANTAIITSNTLTVNAQDMSFNASKTLTLKDQNFTWTPSTINAAFNGVNTNISTITSRINSPTTGVANTPTGTDTFIKSL
ncbi:hypothetical protein EBS02_00325 [bacterium]|nr:hypothetical protein [bacterium]